MSPSAVSAFTPSPVSPQSKSAPPPPPPPIGNQDKDGSGSPGTANLLDIKA